MNAENSKKESYTYPICCLITYFSMNRTIFVFMFYVHTCVRIHVLNMCDIYNNKIGIIVWLGVIILQSLKKGIPWKFWLDPQFPRNSKPKWTLKWLPIDRGYFKFYFYKGESLLIISCHTYFLTRKFVILFQVIFVLPCILFSLKYPVIRCY